MKILLFIIRTLNIKLFFNYIKNTLILYIRALLQSGVRLVLGTKVPVKSIARLVDIAIKLTRIQPLTGFGSL
jgi:hypothetical protein